LNCFNVRHISVRKEGRMEGWIDGWMDGWKELRKVKVKVTLGQAMITQSGSRDIALLFL
jgi:hypothetical protein